MSLVTTKNGGQYTSGTGQNQLDYDYRNGRYVRTVNGVQYAVEKNDPRYNSIAADYAKQNGGIYATGTINNPTGSDIYNKMLEQGYANSKKAAQGQIDSAVNILKTGLDKTNSIYDQAAQNAYINYMMGQKNMNQQLAAQGLGKTGASESTRLAANVDYSSNLNSNEQARQQALQDIYNQIAQTQADGAATLADLDRDLATNQGNAYLSMLAADRDQQNSNRTYMQADRQYNDSKLNDMLDRYIGMGASAATIIKAAKAAGYNIDYDDLKQYSAERYRSIKDAYKK